MVTVLLHGLSRVVMPAVVSESPLAAEIELLNSAPALQSDQWSNFERPLTMTTSSPRPTTLGLPADLLADTRFPITPAPSARLTAIVRSRQRSRSNGGKPRALTGRWGNLAQMVARSCLAAASGGTEFTENPPTDSWGPPAGAISMCQW